MFKSRKTVTTDLQFSLEDMEGQMPKILTAEIIKF